MPGARGAAPVSTASLRFFAGAYRDSLLRYDPVRWSLESAMVLLMVAEAGTLVAVAVVAGWPGWQGRLGARARGRVLTGRKAT
jgi:hypothetical protein